MIVNKETPEYAEWLRKAQDVLDVTAEKLAIQGRRSGHMTYEIDTDSDEQFMCLYRGPDNTKCAVGHWIPDEAYSNKMEGKRWTFNQRLYKDTLPEILNDESLFGLFAALQTAHDSSSKGTFNSTENFRRVFGEVAKYFGLNTNRIDQLVLMTPVVTETTE